MRTKELEFTFANQSLLACYSAILKLRRGKFENERPGISFRKHWSKLKFCYHQEIYVFSLCWNIAPPIYVNCLQTFRISVPGPGMLQVVTRRELQEVGCSYRVAPDALIYREATYQRNNIALQKFGPPMGPEICGALGPQRRAGITPASCKKERVLAWCWLRKQ